MRRRAAGLLAALAGLLAIGAPPAAADVVTVRGASGPGPERYDRVTVERLARARRGGCSCWCPDSAAGPGTSR